jgi:hypothetical protein
LEATQTTRACTFAGHGLTDCEGHDQPDPAAAQAYKIFEKGRKSDAEGRECRTLNSSRSVEPAS